MVLRYKREVNQIFNFFRNTAVSANDGQWHQICATWENSAGSWKMYKDGKVAASGKGFNLPSVTNVALHD